MIIFVITGIAGRSLLWPAWPGPFQTRPVPSLSQERRSYLAPSRVAVISEDWVTDNSESHTLRIIWRGSLDGIWHMSCPVANVRQLLPVGRQRARKELCQITSALLFQSSGLNARCDSKPSCPYMFGAFHCGRTVKKRARHLISNNLRQIIPKVTRSVKPILRNRLA